MTIKSATGLPPSLSHFVFCQYMFWGDSDLTVVPPKVNMSSSGHFSNGDFLTGQGPRLPNVFITTDGYIIKKQIFAQDWNH